jgi:response regulator RpfG family c-di-GMP phosphodiesterase
MSEKVLFVDDEPNVLAGFRRVLGRNLDLATAEGADEGLRIIREEGPFAVVVSDLRMPGLDGIEFLGRVKFVAPDTVRVMFTGHADLQTAVEAINQDLIFRFMQKPAAPEVLRRIVAACIRHHRLLESKRTLLEGTLKGSVKVLTEVLGMVHPEVFSRSAMMGRAARHVADTVGIQPGWHVEVAAMLCDIGCVTLTQESLRRIHAGQSVSEAERQAFEDIPAASARLLASIPYLERVSQIIAAHTRTHFNQHDGLSEEERRVVQGAEVVSAARRFVDATHGGKSPAAILVALRGEHYDDRILTALASLELEDAEMPLRVVNLDELVPGMIVDQDVRARNQVLLVTRGQEITATTVARLQGFAASIGVEEPIRVRCPRGKKAA